MKLQSKIFRIFMPVLIGITAEIKYISAADSVFQAKCSKCHALRNPDNYSKAEWKYNVERMAGRAGLNPQEIAEIIKLNKK